MTPQAAAYLLTGGRIFLDAAHTTQLSASNALAARGDGSIIVELVRSDEAAKAAGEMAHKLADAEAEVASLRAFAQGVMQCWPIGDLDGIDLQDIAVKHGLLTPVQVTAPCSENCSCSEYLSPGDYPATCYRKTPLLTGPEAAP